MNDIEADRLGPQAIKIAIERAKELARRRKAEIDPNLVKLHGGISGLSVEKPIEIVSGLQLAPTYAHVMAPFIMAFKQPELGQAHPALGKAPLAVLQGIFIPRPRLTRTLGLADLIA